MPFSQLYQQLEAQKIFLYVREIGFSEAAAIEYRGRYAIFLDPDCFRSLRNVKAVLAHEIGHCATGCTHRLSSPLDLIGRHEYKANRWAFENCLPFPALQKAVREGFREPWELAEYFDLPEEFIRRAVSYYTGPRALKLSSEADNIIM